MRSQRTPVAAHPRAALRLGASPLATICVLVLMAMSTSRADAYTSAASAPPVRTAAEFLDSVGINIHASYADTAYREQPAVVARLRELGVRHVRDGAALGTDAAYHLFDQLGADGIGVDFIAGEPSGRTGALPDLVALLRTRLASSADAVEGANEYDFSGDPQWPDRVASYQRELVARVRAAPPLAHVPILAPSLGAAENASKLDPTLTPADLANIHSYPGGQRPEVLDPQRSSPDATRRPVVASETGYHNALATTGSHRPTSEEAAAVYLPRLLLEYFRRGVRRTYLYELLDERPDPELSDPEQHFGLLRSDLSPKPAFGALVRMFDFVGATAPQVAQPLSYSLAGETDDVRQVLLQRADGAWVIALWRDEPVWDPDRRQARTVSDSPFASASRRRWREPRRCAPAGTGRPRPRGCPAAGSPSTWVPT